MLTEGSGYGEREALIASIVDILVKEVEPDSADEKFMLTMDARGSNLGWDKIWARAGKKLGLEKSDLNDSVFQDVLLEYARKRGYDDYVKRSEEIRKREGK